MMLLRLLLVVAVLGSSSAIQPRLHGLDKHLEYHYSFEARVAADVGGIGGQRGQGSGEQVAGVAIRGRLIMQKVSDLKMGFEFEAIQVGSHHGPVGCDGMAGMPIKYREIAHEVAHQLYKPFFFSLNIKPKHLRDSIRLEMPADDLLWMVNLRKSMVTNFQDYLILLFREMHQAQTLNLGHRAGQDEFPPVVASRKEDTLFGRCLAWYTLEALTEEELQRARGGAGLLRDMQTPDHQGKKLPSGGRIGSMEHGQLLKLTRIIDHDQCQEGPRLVRSAIGNFTNFGQPSITGSDRGRGNSDQFQRHSSYAYYVRGSPEGLYRIENVQAEGFLSYNPFGLRTQQLQTVTNQSLVLLTVSFTLDPMVPRGPMTTYSSTRFTVLSPYSKPPTGAQDWIIYSQAPATHRVPQPVFWEQVLLGINSTTGDVAERKYKLVELIRLSVEKFRSPTTQIEEKEDRPRPGDQNNVGGTSAGQATSQLHSAQRLAAALPLDALHQVWDQLEGLHREVLVDVLAGSGSGPAVSLLLHLMTSQRAGAPAAIPLRHHAAIVLAMTLNTPDPGVALQLIEYMKTVNLLDEPIVGPIVYVSGARMLRRMCSNSTASLPYPLYGSMQCSRGFVVHAFGDYLLKRMQNVDPQNWAERATLLQAYASLGTITNLEQINSLARSDANLIVQTTAVYAMTSRYLDAHYREEAMLSLWSVLLDQQLSSEVRQSALAAFVSWRPELHWWDQLAKLTWGRGNEDISRFVASTIETTATDHRIDQQQSQFAASALRLARPLTTPFSTSVNMRRSTHDDNIKTGLHGHLAWLKFPNSSHVSQLYTSLSARVGTLPLNLLEFATGFNNYPGLASSKTPSRSLDATAPRLLLSAAEGHHSNRTPGPQMKLLLKLLNSEVFLPIDFQEFGISKYSQCPVCDLLWYNLGPCGGGGGGEALHLLQPAGVEAFLPNEMGLPVLAELVTPIVAYTNTSVEGSSCRAPPGMSTFNITTDTKLVSKVTSVLKVLAPWIEFTVAAGVDLEKSLSFPVSVDGSIEHPFSLSVDPTKPKKNAKKIPPAPSPSSSPSSSPAGGPSSAGGSPSSHPGDPSPSSSAKANCDQRRNMREERALYGTSLTLSLKSTRRNKTPVLFLQTVPFTCIKPLKPGNDNTDLKNLKIVRIKDAQPVKKVVPLLQQSTGIAAMLEYEGDGPFPYTLERLGEVLRSPSRALALLVTPSTAFSRTAFTVHPDQSNNTQCTFTLFTVSTEAAFGRNPDWLPTGRSRRGTGAQIRRQRLQSEQHQCKPGSPPCVSGGMMGMRAVFSPHQYFSLNTSHFVGPSHEHAAVHTSHLASLALKSGATFPHPYKVVAFSNFTRPAPLSLSELAAWLQPQATHSINMTANVTLWGGNLGQSLPLLASALVSEGVSEGRRKLVMEAVPTACAAERQDPATALAGRAVYDAITVRVTTHSKSVPEPALARLSCLKAQLLAALHPSLLFDCSGHQQEGTATDNRVMNIYANRSLLNNKWSIDCQDCVPPWHIRDQESLWCLDRTVFAMATRPETVGNNSGPPVPQQTLRRVRLTPAVAPVRGASETSTPGAGGSQTPGNQQAMSDQLPNKRVNLPETDAAPADMNNQDYAETEDAEQPDEEDASGALGGKSCSTDNTHVVTFDGARYEKWGTKCYELAVANCANNPSFYVYTSIRSLNDVEELTKKDMPMFRYIDGDFKLNIEIAWRYLAINGLSPDHFGQPVDVLYPVTNEKVGHCEFVSSEDSYSCTMNDQVTMSPKRIGGVLTLPHGTNNVCGFCGNANNLAADDNIGAHLCQYTNMSLMAASWTLDASCPQDPTFGAQLEEVHGIQNNIEDCNRLKFPFSWVEDPDLAPDAMANNTLDQKQERQMMRLYQVDQRQQQLARRALQQYRRKTGLQSWEDVQQDQQQSQLLLLQEVIDGLKKSFLSPLPNSGPGSDAVSEAALQPERVPSASGPAHGCMFSAYRVDFLPEPRDQVFLTVNMTNFCNHQMRCHPDNMERVRVTLFGWPLLAAPLPVVRAIDEGYLDELPPHLVPHTKRDGIHYQPSLCSSRQT